MAATQAPTIRQMWSQGLTTVGVWCLIPSSLSAEILARGGFDWVTVDMQHALIDFETAAAMLQSISTTGAAPFIRVPFNEPWLINKALDAGAQGVVVPLVNTRAEAERAAAACRYPPEGRRSFGPIRAAPLVGPSPERCNEEVLCLVMVESREALENLEEICSTPGVDGVYVGPNDLGLSLGVTLDMTTGDWPVLENFVEICRRHGVAAGVHCGSGAVARKSLEAGFTWVSIGSDGDFLAQAAAEAVGAVRGRDAVAPRPSAERTLQTVFGQRPSGDAPAS